MLLMLKSDVVSQKRTSARDVLAVFTLFFSRISEEPACELMILQCLCSCPVDLHGATIQHLAIVTASNVDANFLL